MRAGPKDLVNTHTSFNRLLLHEEWRDQLQGLHSPGKSCCRLSFDREGMERKDVIDSG